MRVLVTGGAGFIGSNLVRALVRAGDDVVVVDNLVSTHSLYLIDDVRDRIVFCHGDVRCVEDFGRVPAGPFDRIYHLAASFANELSVEHPVLDWRSNVEGTEVCLDFARSAGCGLFVYASSSSVYGDVAVPFAEDSGTAPQTPYAESKLVGEQRVLSAGLPCALYRMFNVYGPGDPPGRYRNAIPRMFRAVDQGDGMVRVLGEDSTRDFTYIDDVISILLEAERAAGQIVNLGSGQETAMREVARLILDVCGLAPQRLAIEPRRPWDHVARRVADVSRLRDLHGQVPATPMREGLERTARWLRDTGHVLRDAR